jgi:RimJ/RimL family protein N-acetyltransferase
MPAMDETMPFPLVDGVVAVRPWEEDDLRGLIDAIDDPEIFRWIDLIPQPYTAEEGRNWLAHSREARRDGTATNLAVLDAAQARILGGIGVHWSAERDVGEVGYWLRADARGRGVTTRALVLVARWALSLDGVERLQLRADVQNAASRRVAEKAGFRLEGVLRSARWSPRQQRRYDWAMYSLLRGEIAR